jgi:hypothetical protein
MFFLLLFNRYNAQNLLRIKTREKKHKTKEIKQEKRPFSLKEEEEKKKSTIKNKYVYFCCFV